MKTQVQCQLGCKSLHGWSKIFQMAVCDLNQGPIYCVVSPMARTHGSKNQAMGMGVAPLTITPSDALEKDLLFVPMTLCSACLEVLVSKGEMLPQ